MCSSTLLIALGLASQWRGQSISVDPAEWISESGVYKVRGLMRGALLTSAGVSCYQYVLRSAPQDLRFVMWLEDCYNAYTHLISYPIQFIHILVLSYRCFGRSGLFNSHTYLFYYFAVWIGYISVIWK